MMMTMLRYKVGILPNIIIIYKNVQKYVYSLLLFWQQQRRAEKEWLVSVQQDPIH